VQNAASIAGLLITTEAIVAEERKRGLPACPAAATA
jgi:chaperonin GroEL (HSP60 family)